MQVHSSVMGNSSIVPAKELMELVLIEEWHMSPNEIDAIPYKRLQRLLAVRHQRQAAQETKNNLAALKRDSSSSSTGQVRRTYRNV